MPNPEPSKSLDLLGIKPVSEAINAVTQGTIQGASAFLSRICLPAAEEFGLLLKDRVTSWRTANALKVTQKGEVKFNRYAGTASLHAPPNLVWRVVDSGSWSDEDQIQEMWGGLLASACSPDGRDDSNLIFINLLSQITTVQAKILNWICEKSQKYVSSAGWPYADDFRMPVAELKALTGVSDEHRLDRELDHLRSLELISGETGGGFLPDSQEAGLSPTGFALHFYVRCQGFIGSPIEFFSLLPKPNPQAAQPAQAQQQISPST